MDAVRTVASIAQVGRARWDALFPGEAESYNYLHALERSAIAGFRWVYVLVECGDALIAAAPGFFTDYALDTTLIGPARAAIAAARRLAPRLLTLPLACLGSPCTETALVGFAASLTDTERALAMNALLDGFEQAAQAQGCGLLAVKDVPLIEGGVWHAGLEGLGYRSAPGLPVAWLDIDFDGAEAYLARLSAATRKDMRRKLKAAAEVRIEVRDDLGADLDQVLALYRETRARADMQFEELTPAYFTGVLDEMRGRAFCVLYYVDGELLAANLLLKTETLLLDKFFCMNAEKGRAHNLYFLSWFTNIAYCLEHGLSRYQSGQAAYRNKLRLGSKLTRTAMYFRHRNPLLNAALRAAAPLLAADLEPRVAA